MIGSSCAGCGLLALGLTAAFAGNLAAQPAAKTITMVIGSGAKMARSSSLRARSGTSGTSGSSGEELERLVKKIAATPPEIVELAKQLIARQP